MGWCKLIWKGDWVNEENEKIDDEIDIENDLKNSFVICGRGKTAHPKLKLTHPKISKEHFKIIAEKKGDQMQLFIEDLRFFLFQQKSSGFSISFAIFLSANGTWVNDHKLTKKTPTPLFNGDLIEVAKSTESQQSNPSKQIS